MRMPPHGHDVPDREGNLHHRVLRHKRGVTRQRLSRQRRDGGADDAQLTLIRRQQAQGQAQQGRLAAAVGADEADHLPGANGKGHLGEHRAVLIREGQVTHLKQRRHHSRPSRRCRSSRKRKNGAPMRAVRTPRRNSSGAIRARARQSANTRKAAPTTRARGSSH